MMASEVKTARKASSRTAKTKANSLLSDEDKILDALIEKHDQRGAQGWRKAKGEAAAQAAAEPEEGNVTSPSQQSRKQSQAHIVENDGKAATNEESTSLRGKEVEFKADKNPKTRKGKKKNESKTSKKDLERENGSEVATKLPLQSSKARINSQNNAAVMSPTKSPSKSGLARFSPQKTAGKVMPSDQVQSFLANFDLEAEHRERNAIRTLELSVDSARRQMATIKIGKLPRSVRLLSMRQFLDEFQADVKAVVGKAAWIASSVRQDGEREGETDTIMRKRKDFEEQSPAKAKSRIKVTGREEEDVKTSKQGGKPGRRTRPAPAALPSPISSTTRPPSSATFAPRLRGATVIGGRSSGVPALPPTPIGAKPRTARAGEQVQWTSMNGSPITGIIGPDGAVHALPRAGPSTGNWVRLGEKENEDQDAEEDEDLSEHMIRLAKDVDQRSKRDRARGSSGNLARGVLNGNALAVRKSSSSSRSSASGEGQPRTEMTTTAAASLDGDSTSDDDFTSLPDEEAYTAHVMRQEERRMKSKANTSSSSKLVASSSSPVKRKVNQQRISIVRDNGTKESLTNLRREDLQAMPASERDRLLQILEDLRARQM